MSETLLQLRNYDFKNVKYFPLLKKKGNETFLFLDIKDDDIHFSAVGKHTSNNDKSQEKSDGVWSFDRQENR